MKLLSFYIVFIVFQNTKNNTNMLKGALHTVLSPCHWCSVPHHILYPVHSSCLTDQSFNVKIKFKKLINQKYLMKNGLKQEKYRSCQCLPLMGSNIKHACKRRKLILFWLAVSTIQWINHQKRTSST